MRSADVVEGAAPGDPPDTPTLDNERRQVVRRLRRAAAYAACAAVVCLVVSGWIVHKGRHANVSMGPAPNPFLWAGPGPMPAEWRHQADEFRAQQGAAYVQMREEERREQSWRAVWPSLAAMAFALLAAVLWRKSARLARRKGHSEPVELSVDQASREAGRGGQGTETSGGERVE